MPTNGGTLNGATTPDRRPVSTAAGTQKVVIVNGSPEILELLENVLDAGRYDIVFVESSAHAYSQIKRVQPNLVILCVRIDSMPRPRRPGHGVPGSPPTTRRQRRAPRMRRATASRRKAAS